MVPMVDVIARKIPEIEIIVRDEDGKELRRDTIPMTGLRVTKFFKLARHAIGWENLRQEQMRRNVGLILQVIKPEKGEEFKEPEVDEERMIEAVEDLLPDHVRGCLHLEEYREVWREAFAITISLIFLQRPSQKKTENCLESSPTR